MGSNRKYTFGERSWRVMVWFGLEWNACTDHCTYLSVLGPLRALVTDHPVTLFPLSYSHSSQSTFSLLFSLSLSSHFHSHFFLLLPVSLPCLLLHTALTVLSIFSFSLSLPHIVFILFLTLSQTYGFIFSLSLSFHFFPPFPLTDWLIQSWLPMALVSLWPPGEGTLTPRWSVLPILPRLCHAASSISLLCQVCLHVPSISLLCQAFYSREPSTVYFESSGWALVCAWERKV